MKRSDLNVIFCHEAALSLHLSQEKTKELLSYFFVWKWESYTDYLYHLEKIKSELQAAGLACNSFDLLNCYLDEDKKIEVYERMFKFVTRERIIKKGPSFILGMENRLLLKPQSTQPIRAKFIKEKYIVNSDLKAYTQAVLSSLMVSLGNDGQLDKKELQNCLELLEGVKRICPDFPVKSFDISNALDFVEVPLSEMKKLKKNIVQAIKADGKVDANEITSLKQMSKSISINEDSSETVNKIMPFCALAILISDGEISLKEKEWFMANYKCEEVINTIEEAFWFLSIISKAPKVLNEQQWFLSILWNREKPFYDLANCLFINFAKYFLSLDSSSYNSISEFLIYDSSRKFKEILEAHRNNKVVEEELLLLLNLVFNERYDVSLLNEFLNKDYLLRVFKAFKNDNNPLMYYSAAQSLYSDETMSDEEYKLIWASFESMHLEATKLKDAVYDYSLYLQKELEIGEYFTYLRKEA